MGFMSTNPPPPDESVSLTPAADVAPESFLSVAEVAEGATGVGEAIAGSELIADAMKVLKVGGEIALLVYLLTHVKQIVDLWKQYVAPHIPDVANDLVVPITQLLEPISDGMGILTSAYVGEVARHWIMNQGGLTTSTGTPVGNAAQIAFDTIVNPIATFLQSSPPDQSGSGEKNFQQTLGVIVQIHLITWVVNVISNLTGLGALHYINSFNEVILAALNARAITRVGMKPYINTFVAKPLTEDLNVKWPTSIPNPGSDVKEYIRGAISNADLLAKTAKSGFNPSVTAQLLLDTAKLLSLEEVAMLVNGGLWTRYQGEIYLEQAGYENMAGRLALAIAVNSIAFDNNKIAADKMGAHYGKGDIEDQEYRDFLAGLGFTDLEIQSYITVWGIEREFTTRLTYTQVRDLFNLGLIDLDFVNQYLTDNQNKDSDIALLILLDFTAKDQLDARKAALGATARVQSAKEAAAAAAATAKGETAIATALAAQSAAKARLAAKYGQ